MHPHSLQETLSSPNENIFPNRFTIESFSTIYATPPSLMKFLRSSGNYRLTGKVLICICVIGIAYLIFLHGTQIVPAQIPAYPRQVSIPSQTWIDDVHLPNRLDWKNAPLPTFCEKMKENPIPWSRCARPKGRVQQLAASIRVLEWAYDYCTLRMKENDS